jgi:hypothetical protein
VIHAAVDSRTALLARALIACEQLLEEALDGEIEPEEWTLEELAGLRDEIEDLLVTEAGRPHRLF